MLSRLIVSYERVSEMKKRYLLVCILMAFVLCSCGGGKPTKQEQLELALMRPIMLWCNANDLTLDTPNGIDIARLEETGDEENEYSVSGKFYASDKYGDKKTFKYEGIAKFKDGWEDDHDNIDIPFDEFYIDY